MANNVISGISFPFRTEGNGLPAGAKGTDLIRSAFILLLRTPKGSRVMRPTLGTNIESMLFEDVGPLFEAMIQREILIATNDWLPEVGILNIDVRTEGNKVLVNVQYEIQGVLDETGDIPFQSAA